MEFNEHWGLKDKHAFLSPSQYHWVNYTFDKLEDKFKGEEMKRRGTELHEFASMAIKLNRKLPKNSDTVNMFVNDALGYSMVSEQPLYYSDNCFGTADAISFNRNLLRIHDLKTGQTPASMIQLMVYAALFCLEYVKDPRSIKIELRIYQFNDITVYVPDPEEIQNLMNIIVDFDKHIEEMKQL